MLALELVNVLIGKTEGRPVAYARNGKRIGVVILARVADITDIRQLLSTLVYDTTVNLCPLSCTAATSKHFH